MPRSVAVERGGIAIGSVAVIVGRNDVNLDGGGCRATTAVTDGVGKRIVAAGIGRSLVTRPDGSVIR